MINIYLEKLKKEIKIIKVLFRSRSASNGMTYVELIVVLSIFSVLSGVAIFNYGDFQNRVDIKNLSSDIALQIVQAQKSALSGLLPNKIPTIPLWKPSYGVYFSTISNINGADNKNLIYFTDLNNDSFFGDTDCVGECLSKVTITKNNYISRLDVFYQGQIDPASLVDLTVTFLRPNSGTTIKSSSITDYANISYVQITVSSPNGVSSLIKLYPSGRIQIN